MQVLQRLVQPHDGGVGVACAGLQGEEELLQARAGHFVLDALVGQRLDEPHGLLDADVGSGGCRAGGADGLGLAGYVGRSGLGACGQHVGVAAGLVGGGSVLVEREGEGVHRLRQGDVFCSGLQAHGLFGHGGQRLLVGQQFGLGRAYQHVGVEYLVGCCPHAQPLAGHGGAEQLGLGGEPLDGIVVQPGEGLKSGLRLLQLVALFAEGADGQRDTRQGTDDGDDDSAEAVEPVHGLAHGEAVALHLLLHAGEFGLVLAQDGVEPLYLGHLVVVLLGADGHLVQLSCEPLYLGLDGTHVVLHALAVEVEHDAPADVFVLAHFVLLILVFGKSFSSCLSASSP